MGMISSNILIIPYICSLLSAHIAYHCDLQYDIYSFININILASFTIQFYICIRLYHLEISVIQEFLVYSWNSEDTVLSNDEKEQSPAPEISRFVDSID